jgi:ubiquinone biosynthesis protein Coq4
MQPTPARLRRHWRAGLGNLYRFLAGSGGLGSAFEAMFALAGPTVQQEFERFAESEVGRRLLAEQPRRDLNAFLADREALAAMPKGSFADAYLAYMGGQGMGSADYFLEAADLDEKARRFGWTADQAWFVRRMANSHDLFHVIAGYDRDIIGGYVRNAYRHGQQTPNLACVDYESMLPLPLAEVRHKIGVPAPEQAHPQGLPSPGRTLRRIERNLNGG